MIYDFKVKKTNGEEILLEKYKGKVLLIVNTASGCGFTPQYEGLQKIYDEYKDKGFEILDFPCNQFFQQAPGSDAELSSFCKLTYGTTFENFAKIEVNGENELAYLSLTSKNESVIRDRIAYKLHLELKNSIVAREHSIKAINSRIDLAVLENNDIKDII